MRYARTVKKAPPSSAAGQNAAMKADFRVRFSDGDGWIVAIVSDRARRWAQASLDYGGYVPDEDVVRTDLAGVNDLVSRARLQGYVSEYIGPSETVRL